MCPGTALYQVNVIYVYGFKIHPCAVSGLLSTYFINGYKVAANSIYTFIVLCLTINISNVSLDFASISVVVCVGVPRHSYVLTCSVRGLSCKPNIYVS